MKTADIEHLAPISDRALEMVMRDVLDELTELSLESAYANSDYTIEVVDISPPGQNPKPLESVKADAHTTEAEIFEFTPLKRASG